MTTGLPVPEGASTASINLVVFSYNRPLQLYAFLESFEYNVRGCARISVIYKTTSQDFDRGYKRVKQRFRDVKYYHQTAKARSNFKPLTLKAIDFDKEEFIIFAVDDIIVTRPINCCEITKILKNRACNGFYLRLGANITTCYTENKVTGIPPFKKILPGVLKWRFQHGTGDWDYPHTLDMTIYRKKELRDLFMSLDFDTPNTLEYDWACEFPAHPFGLCYEQTCIINCPLNIIQTDFPDNRNSNEYTVKELLELFLAGYKLDISPLQHIHNNAPHMDYKPTFIWRLSSRSKPPRF